MAQSPKSEIDRENPWPGLSSFTEDTRGFFFGRDRETEELARLVRRETLTVLFGQSGLGKSSLLQAGLFPLLRDTDHLPLYLRLDHSPQVDADLGAPSGQNATGGRVPPQASLSEQVKTALNAAFIASKADAPPVGPEETLWEYFHRKDVDIWSAKNRLLTPVLTFDQFEEIFTLGRADDARRERSRAFLTELADLVENRPPAALREKFDRGEIDPTRFNYDKPSCRVILSLREDFLPDLEGLKQELPALIHNRLRLKRLNGAQALEAVTRPAPQLLAEGVGEKIVEFVAGARGGSAERLLEMEVEPALLSVICRELNERRRALGQSQITADLVSGNRREILNDFYERSVGDLPDGMRAFVEDHLLTKSGFRDNMALETALEFPGVTRPLIDTLVARRLLRLEERLGIQRVELTHDVLADVVKASRDARQQRLALEEAAARERATRDDAIRRTRRMRFAIVGLVAAVVALSIGAVFGIRAQQRSAEQASQTDFVLGSRLLDDGKLSEGLAYLVRAGTRNPGNRLVAPRLLSALITRNFMLPAASPLALSSPGLNAHYTADGRLIVVQTEDDRIWIIDAAQWTPARRLEFGGKVRRNGLVLARNNHAVFAVLLVDGSILLGDTASSQPRHHLIPPEPVHGGRIPRFELSPDGRWLAVSSHTTVYVWDTTRGDLRARLPNDFGIYQDFAFSPDGKRIATTHAAGVTQVWSLPDGAPACPPISNPTGRWAAPKFSDDGRQLALMIADKAVIYDTVTTMARGTIPMINNWGDFWLTRDGSGLLVAVANTVTHYDVSTGKPKTPAMVHAGPIRAARLVQDGQLIFTNSVDGMVRLWVVETGALVAQPTLRHNQFAPAAVSPDGKAIAVFGSSGAIYPLRPGRGAALPLEFPRDNESVILVNMAAGVPARLAWMLATEIKRFDLASGREVEGFKFPKPILAPRGSIRSTFGGTLGPSDKLLVQTEPAGQPPIWRAWSAGERALSHDVVLTDVPDDVTTFRVQAGGNLVPTSGSRATRTELGIWDMRTGKRVVSIRDELPISHGATPPSFSADERRVAYRTEDFAVHVCDVATGKELSVLRHDGKASIMSLRFLLEGYRIVTGDDWGGVHVWDTTSGRLLSSTQAHRGSVGRIDFSPNGQYMATHSPDGSVQVWDAKTVTRIGSPLVQAGGATRADFTADGTRIITPSSSGTARVWDVQSSEPVSELLDNDGAAVGVCAFSPDARFVEMHGTGRGGFSGIRVLPAPPNDRGAPTPKWLLELATICAGQRLTDEGKLVGATEAFARIDDVRRELAGLPVSDPYAEWGRWILSDDPNRPIAPHFTITPAEAKKLREEFAKPAAAGAATSSSAP